MSGTVDWLSESAARIPRLIVVALTNTNRGRDMTASHNNGGGDLFIQFIANELIPFLNDEYRTKPFRILAGHSMAGHLALNVLEQKPELFNAYIAMSPFFHQDRGERKLAEVLANKVSKPEFANRFLYLSIGDEIRLKPKYDVLVDALSAKANPSLNWYSKTSNTDSHMSIVSNTVNEALQFVFAPQRLSPDSETAKAGVESIKAYYKKLSNEKYGYEISPEGAINRLGYHWLWEGNTKKAIAIFEANTKEFPSSPNVYDSLAEAYQRDKKLELALATIHRAIALGEAQKLESVRWMKRREQRIKDALSSVNE